MINEVMQIVLNGDDHTLPSEMTLAQLVEHLGIDRRLVALAHNGEVVPRDTYEQVTVHDGDAVEIVRMVGGG
ncbi:MAG: sulfur carrier protein ThiS [Dehalococcoidia bacterium]